MYSYVVTSQKPTAVQHTLVCNFTAPNDHNLIIAKGNHLEIHTLCDTGLIAEIDLPIFGKITSLNYFRYNGINQDNLFILTEKKHFCVLGWDVVNKKFISKVTGNLNDRVSARDSDIGQRCIIDPSRYISIISFYYIYLLYISIIYIYPS